MDTVELFLTTGAIVHTGVKCRCGASLHTFPVSLPDGQPARVFATSMAEAIAVTQGGVAVHEVYRGKILLNACTFKAP